MSVLVLCVSSIPTEVGRVPRLPYVRTHVSVFPYEQREVWGREEGGVMPSNALSSGVLVLKKMSNSGYRAGAVRARIK